MIEFVLFDGGEALGRRLTEERDGEKWYMRGQSYSTAENKWLDIPPADTVWQARTITKQGAEEFCRRNGIDVDVLSESFGPQPDKT